MPKAAPPTRTEELAALERELEEAEEQLYVIRDRRAAVERDAEAARAAARQATARALWDDRNVGKELVAEAREAFRDTVRAGGDTLSAWIEYRRVLTAWLGRFQEIARRFNEYLLPEQQLPPRAYQESLKETYLGALSKVLTELDGEWMDQAAVAVDEEFASAERAADHRHEYPGATPPAPVASFYAERPELTCLLADGRRIKAENHMLHAFDPDTADELRSGAHFYGITELEQSTNDGAEVAA